MINVSGVSKKYGGRQAVSDISFQVAPGRVTGFVGPNGAGKSTTMRMMVGLTKPDSGDVRYAGTRYRDLSHPARMVGSVLDAKCMVPGRTARSHLRAMAAASRIPMSRVDEVLETVGLQTAAKQRAGKYSLGMKQRLALAGALLGNPEVLLLDEPANGLDPDGIRWLRNKLRAFADGGGTVFVSSHLISELSQFADDLVVIGGGRLLANDTVEAIESRSERHVVVSSDQLTNLASALQATGAMVQPANDQLIVRGLSKDQVSELAFNEGIRIIELTEVGSSLEDQLIEMTSAAAEFGSSRPPQPPHQN